MISISYFLRINIGKITYFPYKLSINNIQFLLPWAHVPFVAVATFFKYYIYRNSLSEGVYLV